MLPSNHGEFVPFAKSSIVMLDGSIINIANSKESDLTK